MNANKPENPRRAPSPLGRRQILLGGASIVASVAAVPALAQSANIACSESQVGSVWWSELVAVDPVQARAFHTKILGWTAKVVAVEDNTRPPNPGEEEYTLFLRNGQEVAGLTKAIAGEANGLRPGWLPYVQVTSVDDAVTETLKTGGKVLRFPIDVAKVGRLAVIEDLSGTQIGIVTPTASAPG
jgi:predicted enzyme related to lactoylglutathione lyase